jgi:hypothetical protein
VTGPEEPDEARIPRHGRREWSDALRPAVLKRQGLLAEQRRREAAERDEASQQPDPGAEQR